MPNYKALQNGSDIRGVALATPEGPSVNLDMEAAGRLALGFVDYLIRITEKSPGQLKIAVGRDPRITGQGLEVVICQIMASKGIHVMSAGLASTPAMFMSTVFADYKCDGAIMITASHMPKDRNGMKFFGPNGGLEKADISEIIELAEAGSSLPMAFSSVAEIPLMESYAAHLRGIITEALGDDAPLSGLKITVDAGNGGGGFFATDVLYPLGADISSSQFLEPDGEFPNHIPNPENKEAMASICEKVKSAKSHLGLIFDTDVDRASAVDENGKEISRNGIVAMAAALIAKDHPGTTVVTDSVTSNQLSKFLTENLGLKHLRYKRGYRNVIGKAIELNDSGIDSQLAIETSGHGAYKQNYFLDDGAYLATLIVIETARLAKEGKGISFVIERLEEPLEARELRLPLSGEDFAQIGEAVINDLKAAVEAGTLSGCKLAEPNYEGVRIDFFDDEIQGWALLRKSLHDPIMPLNMEAMAEGGCQKISDMLKPVLEKYKELDISLL